ncbi:MAG: aspartate--tRNA(Asn) ligase, partial [Spirochaetaceae bacterium]|nr:aspartate--tRNA(Asn) ligase [Spirochaetaceae bacterium]
EAESDLPIAVNQDPDSLSLEAILDNRMISLRNPKILSIFRLQAACVKAFADFFRGEDFTQIKTSKIIGGGSEGGTNLFSMDYFGKTAYLAQSPQLYKQTMVSSGLERVFEIGHAYRAEKHETPRHINEYVSLDIEMAFIDSEKPLMEIERNFMAYLFETVRRENAVELKAWNATVPDPDSCKNIPIIPHDEAKAVFKAETGKRALDINPEAERVLCDWAEREYGIPMVFINEFPRRKRPFYTYPEGNKTMSFDLIFRGLEITTGGRRINEYSMFKQALAKFGMTEEELGSYVDIFKYGCPPHGGFAIGLERVTQKILGLANIKEATLFPRDRKRVAP